MSELNVKIVSDLEYLDLKKTMGSNLLSASFFVGTTPIQGIVDESELTPQYIAAQSVVIKALISEVARLSDRTITLTQKIDSITHKKKSFWRF